MGNTMILPAALEYNLSWQQHHPNKIAIQGIDMDSRKLLRNLTEHIFNSKQT